MAIDYRVVSMRRISIRGQDYGNNAVSSPSLAYGDMVIKWELIDDLLAGTNMMRDRGERWLPREPNEPPANYRIRVLRSFLYGAFKDTVGKIVSRPFSRTVTVQEEDALPEQLKDLSTDADRAGCDLTQLAAEVFETMVAYGKAHILVDFPMTGGNLNLAEERASGVRPIFRFVHPHDLIGWRHEKGANGEEQLTQVRIREFKCEPVAEYGERFVTFIRVINAPLDAMPETTASTNGDGTPQPQSKPLGTWQLWRQDPDSGNFTDAGSGTHTFPGVPLVTAYAKRTGFMKAEPPMMDLAEKNLEHWQSSSDQRNVLRFARIGMIAMTGISAEEIDKQVTIAPSSTLRSTNPDAKFYYVEPGGKSIEVGQADVAHIEEQMEVMGSQPFVARTADSTATGKSIDDSNAQCDVIRWCRALENMLEEAYEYAGIWVGVMELDDKFSVDVFTDFAMTSGNSTDNEFLLKARSARELSRPTFLNEIKRRGTISDTVDVQEEMDELDREGPLVPPGADPNNPFGDPTKPPANPDDEPTPEGDKPPPPFGKPKPKKDKAPA